MRKGRDWMERLTSGLDLPAENVPGIPLVEIYGERRVLIEHHFGVTQYGKEKICAKVKFGHVIVCGSELELARMTKGQLIICGKIESVILQRRKG